MITLTFRRTQTVKIELPDDTPKQYRETIDWWANYGFCGGSMIDQVIANKIPGSQMGKPVNTDWLLLHPTIESAPQDMLKPRPILRDYPHK